MPTSTEHATMHEELAFPAHMLPPEVTLEILGYLQIRDLGNVAQVCKHWHLIAEEGTLWSALYKRNWALMSSLFLRKHHNCKLCRYVRHTSSDHRTPELKDHGNQGPCWKSTCMNKQRLEKRWREGKYSSHTLFGHGDFVRCLQYDDDINTIVSGSYDSTVRLWDMTTMKCNHTLRGHGNWVICLQFIGNTLITGSSDKTLKLWNINTAECMSTLQGHTHSVICLQFDIGGVSADTLKRSRGAAGLSGTGATGHMITGSYDKTFRYWDLATGTSIRCVEGHQDKIRYLNYDDTKMVSCSDDKTLRVWDMRDMSRAAVLEGHSDRVHVVQMKDHRVISGGADNCIKEWDLRTGNCVQTLKGHTNCVRFLQYDSSKIVSASWDRTIRMWPAAKSGAWEESPWTLNHEDCVLYAQFDDEKMVTGSGDKTIKIWRFDMTNLPRKEFAE